jgi:hypothetical protein
MTPFSDPGSQGYIHDMEFGWLLDEAQHDALHAAKWNDVWEAWRQTMVTEGNPFTLEAVQEQLGKMMGQKAFCKILKNGFHAITDWKSGKWRNGFDPELLQTLDDALKALPRLNAAKAARVRLLFARAGRLTAKSLPVVFAAVQGIVVGNATASDKHFQQFVEDGIEAEYYHDRSRIRGAAYKEALYTVPKYWSQLSPANGTGGYQSGEDFVNALADAFDQMSGPRTNQPNCCPSKK